MIIRGCRLGICVLIGIWALAVAAQGRGSARIVGEVRDEDRRSLAGAVIRIQPEGAHSAVRVESDSNGRFFSPMLPAGRYELVASKEGHQTTPWRLRLLASTDLELSLLLYSQFVECGFYGRSWEMNNSITLPRFNVDFELLDTLPAPRTYAEALSLAPGVHATGPLAAGGPESGQATSLSISGGQSWDNLFLLDGLVLNETLTGQPQELLIEDSLQEVTVRAAGVEAEYGRQTGGVAVGVTRSGGNQFRGTFRVSLDNDDWIEETRLSVPRTDDIEETIEATLGGRLVRDRVWFFLSGLTREQNDQRFTRFGGSRYDFGRARDRMQGKLTSALSSAHQLQLSVVQVQDEQANRPHGGLAEFALLTDDGTLVDATDAQQGLSLHYGGVLSPRWFLEAQYSEREFRFENAGGLDQSLETGTPVFDLAQGVVYNESLFCGVCGDEVRDNKSGRLKAAYFVSGGSSSHDIQFGYETFEDIRRVDNHQSPNDLMIWQFVPSTTVGGSANLGLATSIDEVFPVVTNGTPTNLVWLPILDPSQGTSFETDSFFVSDRWRLGNRWELSVGLRYDDHDAVDSSGAAVASDEAISPRVAVSYESSPETPWSIHGSYGRYVGLTANPVFDRASIAGRPAEIDFSYFGPDFTDQPASMVLQPWIDAVQAACPLLPAQFWTDAGNFDLILDGCLGATHPDGRPLVDFINRPGLTTRLDPGLSSTVADEFTVGFRYLIGWFGFLRLDYVRREFDDFFLTRRDLASNDPMTPFDDGIVVNDQGLLSREYEGLHVHADLSLLEDRRLRIGGNLTWSQATGNFDGEDATGPLAGDLGSYPEYVDPAWNAPVGALGIDQRWVLRTWLAYDLFRKPNHTLNLAWLGNYYSGRPYEAVGTINVAPFVSNPGYATPDVTREYFFSGRGAFRTDDIQRMDLTLNYVYYRKGWEFFVQPEIWNLLGEDGTVRVNSTVNVGSAFNPFTDTPQEGVNFALGNLFGQPLTERDLQAPRQYRISLGFRVDF